MFQKKIGVILAGSGVYDGSEIHEATLTLLSLDQQDVSVTCLSVDTDQHHVVDHTTQQEQSGSKRNCLIESGRISRGEVTALDTIQVSDFDGFIFPGGFGVAKNLCSFAIDGINHTVHPQISSLIHEAHSQKKPMGFLCISPVIPATLIPGVRLTIGSDSETAQAIEKMGAHHVNTTVSEIVVDEKNYIVSTPAYMLAGRISELSKGIDNLVNQVVEWAKKPTTVSEKVVT